jgi:hypothetical protein
LRQADRALAAQLERSLREYEKSIRALPGINTAARRRTFVEQLVESSRRVRYIGVLGTRRLSDACSDPMNGCFDPIKAALVNARRGNTEEAYWLVFLFVHFGALNENLENWPIGVGSSFRPLR